MAARAARLRQSDLTRYAKAMQEADVLEWRIEAHPDGKHAIIVGKVDASASGPDPDELLR